MAKIVEVKSVFSKDKMFLGQDGRLYRYSCEKDGVKAYEKTSPAELKETKVYNFPDSRQESDFWVINTKEQRVFFKAADGSLKEVISLWDNEENKHSPFIYGDLLFVIDGFTPRIIAHYNRTRDAFYRVLRAQTDQSSYQDITDQICSKDEKIASVVCRSMLIGQLGVTTNQKNLKVLMFHRLSYSIYLDASIWEEVELSEESKSYLQTNCMTCVLR